MDGLTDWFAVAFAVFAAAVAAVALVLDLLGSASGGAALVFVAAGLAAGALCLLAWLQGARADRRRVPLLVLGLVLPAFAAFTLASAVGRSWWAFALDAVGIAAVVIAAISLREHTRRGG
jgi:hypothetical protein